MSLADDSASTATEPVDYGRLRQDLARAVARICPGWLSNQRDDLVQTAVMRVMQIISNRARDGEGDSALRASYLYKVAYSALVDEIRRVRRRRETALDDTVAEPPTVREDPERATASREISTGIQECLTRLKRERRLAVTLYLQGHSVPSAARVLDWTPKRTENLVYRGLAELRECLMSKGIRP